MKRKLIHALLGCGLLVSVITPQAAASAPSEAEPAAGQFAAIPGGDPVANPSAPVPGPRTAYASTSKADCDALIASVRAGKRSSYPRTCTSGTVVSAADGNQPAVDPWPSECSTGTGTTTPWIATSRRQACNHEVFGLTVIEVPSGRVLGTATFHSVGKLLASTTMARWASTTDVWVWSWTGVGFPEWSTGDLAPCPGNCLGTSVAYTKVNFDSWRGTGNIDPVAMASGRIINDVYGDWNVTFGSSKYGNSVTFTLTGALSRCDNAIGGRVPGCVFANIPSVVGFSQTTVPEFVNHVYRAQVSGLPGRLSTGTYLTRLTDQTKINANGATACPSSIPRPTGKSCDEYPFRSTNQGASTGGSAVARSFPDCQMPDPQRTGATGFSRCFIIAGQNSSAGGTLGGFYANERMLQGDPFQVGYLP